MLKLVAGLYGAEINNIWFYGNANSTGDAGDLSLAFQQDVLPSIMAIQSEDLVYASIEIQGVRNTTVLYSNTLTVNGDVASAADPAFLAWSYRMNRQGVGERHGFKRFAGCPDAWIVDGTYDPSHATEFTAVATALAAEIDQGFAHYVPLIKQVTEVEVPENPISYHTFLTAAFRGVSTQNSRKLSS